MRHAMIMAGGAGTRLWPLSRQGLPKQLLRFIPRPGGKRGDSKDPTSLLAIAARRIEGIIPLGNRYICTAEQYREAVLDELPGYKDSQVIGEPVARDTVNAIGLTAAILAKTDPEAIFAVLTADHIIEPIDAFRDRLDIGFKLVEDDPRRLVTFSIKPTYPATGFGYVERGTPIRGVAGAEKKAFHVARFVEKPDLPRAEAYVRSGEFAWNSGMFVWRASTFLEALEKFKPESHAGLMEIQAAWGKRGSKSTLERVYPTLPKISVDYAVLEPAARSSASAKNTPKFSVCTVLMDLTWLDVGSWPSYAETIEPDADSNRHTGVGRLASHAAKNNLVVDNVKGHTIALLGVDDLIVVHTQDATLIMPKSKAEDLKKLHEKLDERIR